MEALRGLDTDIVVWLNEWAGRNAFLDGLEKLIISDYFIPALFGLCLLAAWFMGKDPQSRDPRQRAVLKALIAMGFANLVVLILNQHYFRERPFAELDLTLLFYTPTDSSFPSNPATVGFALAAGMWQGSRRLGVFLFGLAALWGLSRIYAGVFYPSDVAGGALIGVGMSYVVALAFRLIEPIPTIVLRVTRTLHLA